MRGKECSGCIYDKLSDDLFTMRKIVDHCSYCKRFHIVLIGNVELKDLYDNTLKSMDN